MNVILEQLKTHTQNKPNDIALHIDDETITYSQLNAASLAQLNLCRNIHLTLSLLLI